MTDEQDTSTEAPESTDAGATPVEAKPEPSSGDEYSAAEKALADKLRSTREPEATAPDKPESEAKEPTEKPGKTEKPALDWRLKTAAELAGMSEADLKDADERTLKVLNALADKIDAEHKAATTKDPDAVKAAERAANAFDIQKPFAFAAAQEGEDDPFSAETREMILNPIQEYLQGIGQMVKDMLPYHQAAKAREEQAEFDAIEGFFSARGKDFKDVFGDGPTASLSEGSKEAEARAKLYEEALQIRQYRAKQGRPMTTSQALHAALSMLHGDRLKQVHQRELVAKAEKQTARISGRPNVARAAGPVRSDDQAVQAVAQKVREFGVL